MRCSAGSSRSTATVNGAQMDLMRLPLDGAKKLQPPIQTPFNEYGARLSPDGRAMAYTSMESGRAEVHVRAFPPLEGKTQVSTSGGDQPQWSRRGGELDFVTPDAMMAAPAQTGLAPAAGDVGRTGAARRPQAPSLRPSGPQALASVLPGALAEQARERQGPPGQERCRQRVVPVGGEVDTSGNVVHPVDDLVALPIVRHPDEVVVGKARVCPVHDRILHLATRPAPASGVPPEVMPQSPRGGIALRRTCRSLSPAASRKVRRQAATEGAGNGCTWRRPRRARGGPSRTRASPPAPGIP